jgi:hypothetical protein
MFVQSWLKALAKGFGRGDHCRGRRKGGGIPLFVEELTRVLLDSGDTKFTAREIPATLHDSLLARLDRLGPAKEVIQIGAVLGTEFSYQLLHDCGSNCGTRSSTHLGQTL